MNIRLATKDDIPEIQNLIDASVRGLSGAYYTPPQIESALKYIFGVDSHLLQDSTYFVVEDKQKLVGAGGWSMRKTLFGGDQMRAGEADAVLDPAREPARIRAFYVHPGWARRGIGRWLVETCEAEAAKAGFVRMQLVATLPGEPLYAAQGYVRVEPVEMPMPDGLSISGFLMEKPIA